jgi:hypothetical protein
VKNITTKQEVLNSILEVADAFTKLYETHPSPDIEQAVMDSLYEYELVKSIADDENFIINRINLLIQSGLFDAAVKRLDILVEHDRKFAIFKPMSTTNE